MQPGSRTTPKVCLELLHRRSRCLQSLELARSRRWLFTPAVNDWLDKRPRFHEHSTPTGSSRISQVERWLGFLTDQLLRRCVHKSVQPLEKDARGRLYLDEWKKAAEEILDSHCQICLSNFWCTS